MWAALVEAGDGAEDDLRVSRGEGRVSQPEPVQDARSKALDHHLKPGQEAEQEFPPRRTLQVDRDGALAPIEGVKGAAEPLVLGRQVAEIITRGSILHLDHVSAEIGQDEGTERPGQQPGEIKNANALKRAGGHKPLSFTPG